MKIKHHYPDISKDNPFEHCKLGRKKYADVLTTIVNNYKDGFVLAINNSWGTGKTTFLKMWKQDLENQGFKTLYFNAWENDIENTPLIALMGELKVLSNDKKSKAIFKSLTRKAGSIAKNVTPVLIESLAKKYLGVDNFSDFINKLTESSIELIENEIEKYSKKKQGIEEFKSKLVQFINEVDTSHPVVFMIDELDRCRPNYAVEVLENVKHFFNVPGIVFIISIDKVQLCSAIKGVYGNDNFDSNEYLRRFIDLEYQIPEPDTGLFCQYLFEYYDFNIFFSSLNRRNNGFFHDEEERFLKMANLLFDSYKLSLRHQEQVFAYARLVIGTISLNAYLFPDIMIFLVLIKYQNAELYDKIQNKRLTLNELNDELNKILPDLDYSDQIANNYLLYMQAKIIYRYSLNYSKYSLKSIIETNKDDNTSRIKIKSKYETKPDQFEFNYAFTQVSNSDASPNLGLDYIISKINLFDKINNWSAK